MIEYTIEQSSFNYNGKPVERKREYFDTPLGRFKVFESVGGGIFYKYPLIIDDVKDNKFIRFITVRCETFDKGKQKCEEIWNEFKEKVNKI